MPEPDRRLRWIPAPCMGLYQEWADRERRLTLERDRYRALLEELLEPCDPDLTLADAIGDWIIRVREALDA